MLNVETSAFVAATSAIAQRSFNETISALDTETSSLDAETSAIARSYRDIGAEFPAISAIAELV